VAWELTSVISFLLIGFKGSDGEARRGALQALMITGAGGLALFVGLLLAGSAAGSMELSDLLASGDLLRSHPWYTAITVLVMLGSFSKSAQFPLHFWLPGAMSAPTPASAFLHSATMVKAGIYLLLRLSPVLGDTPLWENGLLWIGGATALIAALFAMWQLDLKGILAYSTVSQLGTLVLLIGLPVLGVWLAGRPVGRYFEFPPHSRYLAPAPFSWAAVAVILLCQAPLWVPVISLASAGVARALGAVGRQRGGGRSPAFGAWRFPRWGWGALAWTGAWWVVAWTRLPAFEAVQRHTFTPLWIGYIAIVNGLVFAVTGRCMVTHEPRRLARLFAASAAFWWFFEYLNRFVQNWYYVDVEAFSPFEYCLFATLSFSTVLPAVLGTADLIDALVPRAALTRCRPRLFGLNRGRSAWLLLAASAGLAGIGVWPDHLFPLLWFAPLLILVAFRGLRGEPTMFAGAARGDWRRLAVLSLAALVCGFFWEMWNVHSLARWIYQVPFVGVWKVFEMPLLGYAGYLPFGWECAVIADALTAAPPRRSG
jgi:hypothetical protein